MAINVKVLRQWLAGCNDDDTLKIIRGRILTDGHQRINLGVEHGAVHEPCCDYHSRPYHERFFVDAKPLPCGCHCCGGCADPYAACANPCNKHVPF